ncbi:unnamed protein product [Ascophyllum nodosum]
MSRELDDVMDEESIPCPIVLLRGEMLTEEMDGLYRVTTKENAVSDILTVRLACGAGDATTFSGSRLYYEARVESGGAVVLGLAGPGFDEGVENQPERPGVGDVMPSWAFDGARRRKRTRQISNMYGQRWKAGDMVGVLLDIDTKEISFSLNGKDLGPAFTLNDEEVKGLYPAASLHFGQAVVFNFGRAPFEYNPRERGCKPPESRSIEAPKPKPRRKSIPKDAAPATSPTAAPAAKAPPARGKRLRDDSAGEDSALDDDRTSDGEAEESSSTERSGKANGYPRGGVTAGRGGGGSGGGRAHVESEAQSQYHQQMKEIDGLLRHETLLEGMQEIHTRHRRERKALLATQRKEVQRFFQRNGGSATTDGGETGKSRDEEGAREVKRSRSVRGDNQPEAASEEAGMDEAKAKA